MFINAEDLIKAYAHAEQARMKLFSMIIPSSEYEDLNTEQVEFIKGMVQSEIKDGYVKITINDILPTNAGLSKNDIKFHWLSLMNYALKDINIKFKKVLCVVVIYSPASYWDTDNRSLKVVQDALRYKKIIPDDRSQYLANIVIGQTDKDNPRTEIYLLENPENPLWFLPEYTK